MTTDMSIEGKILKKKWFYSFTLPSGKKTEVFVPPEIESIHPTRIQMLFSVLDPIYRNRWSEIDALDIASNQGYFSFHLAEKGCKKVVGVEARANLIEDAEMVKAVKRLSNVTFIHADAEKLAPEDFGTFDVVLMMGLIYHLENPIGALRNAAKMTKDILLIETQVCPDMKGEIDWGSRLNRKNIHGAFALIDETQKVANPLNSINGFALCPSREALFHILSTFGFSKIDLVPAPEGGNEQLVDGKRVMVAARR